MRNFNQPRSLVVVFPDEIWADLSLPTIGNLVDTTLWEPMSPIVYTFDSPRREEICYWGSTYTVVLITYIAIHSFLVSRKILPKVRLYVAIC